MEEDHTASGPAILAHWQVWKVADEVELPPWFAIAGPLEFSCLKQLHSHSLVEIPDLHLMHESICPNAQRYGSCQEREDQAASEKIGV